MLGGSPRHGESAGHQHSRYRGNGAPPVNLKPLIDLLFWRKQHKEREKRAKIVDAELRLASNRVRNAVNKHSDATEALVEATLAAREGRNAPGH